MAINIDGISVEFAQKVMSSKKEIVDAISVLNECATKEDVELLISEEYIDKLCIKVNTIFTYADSRYILFRNLELKRLKYTNQ